MAAIQTGAAEDNGIDFGLSDESQTGWSASPEIEHVELEVIQTAAGEMNEIDLGMSNESQKCQSTSSEIGHMESGEIHRLVRELGYLIVGMKDKAQKRLYCGAVIKMMDLMKGNGDHIEGMTLESVLEANMYMFKRPSAGFAFSREATCTRDIERGGPPMANNHCKKRKKISQRDHD